MSISVVGSASRGADGYFKFQGITSLSAPGSLILFAWAGGSSLTNQSQVLH